MSAIALWSGPRNVSTALMYSFANRSDMKVLDEPLFPHFLKFTGVWRPSRDEVLSSMSTDAKGILTQMSGSDTDSHVFSKNMANHIEGLDPQDYLPFRHIILTRHPAAVIASYRKQIDRPDMRDLCYQHQLKLLQDIRDSGSTALVVDSDELRRNPEESLKRICEFVDIPFEASMLHWEAGPRPEDGPWAKYWYHAVHRSTGFDPPEEREYEIPVEHQDLYLECLDLYHQIKQFDHE